MSLTRLARKKAFQCPALTGRCFLPTGMGHNYELEVYFSGPVDPLSGMILNIADADKLLDNVIGPISGQDLGHKLQEFIGDAPSAENVGLYLTAQLQSQVQQGWPGVQIVKVRLYESEDLWVDIWP